MSDIQTADQGYSITVHSSNPNKHIQTNKSMFLGILKNYRPWLCRKKGGNPCSKHQSHTTDFGTSPYNPGQTNSTLQKDLYVPQSFGFKIRNRVPLK